MQYPVLRAHQPPQGVQGSHSTSHLHVVLSPLIPMGSRAASPPPESLPCATHFPLQTLSPLPTLCTHPSLAFLTHTTMPHGPFLSRPQGPAPRTLPPAWPAAWEPCAEADRRTQPVSLQTHTALKTGTDRWILLMRAPQPMTYGMNTLGGCLGVMLLNKLLINALPGLLLKQCQLISGAGRATRGREKHRGDRGSNFVSVAPSWRSWAPAKSLDTTQCPCQTVERPLPSSRNYECMSTQHSAKGSSTRVIRRGPPGAASLIVTMMMESFNEHLFTPCHSARCFS